MRKFLFLALALSSQAAALSPSDVMQQFGARSTFVMHGDPNCSEGRAFEVENSYPVLKDASEKFITSYSYLADLDVNINKTMVELYAISSNLEASNAWIGSEKSWLTRDFVHPKTANYIYRFSLYRTESSNPYLDKTAVCVVILGLR